MIEDELSCLETEARSRIESAASAEELETIRIDVLGRKGTLAQLSKEMGKLAPEQRASAGKRLNAVKQVLESVFEEKKAQFDRSALERRLDAEWIDVTLPAPGTRPGSLHPITQIRREIEQ